MPPAIHHGELVPATELEYLVTQRGERVLLLMAIAALSGAVAAILALLPFLSVATG